MLHFSSHLLALRWEDQNWLEKQCPWQRKGFKGIGGLNIMTLDMEDL